jgi:hypothetical protein
MVAAAGLLPLIRAFEPSVDLALSFVLGHAIVPLEPTADCGENPAREQKFRGATSLVSLAKPNIRGRSRPNVSATP